ncbi:peptidase M20 [Streptomyces sulfonofaciens]|uniref:Peptidase M20 n=1 Tax=Streptomyces sulfonofaciens TaxID=68272 RepID=A0A919G3Q0_9ACTN|nr:amidohydrolase [Streptomyces sulfonofaciens]GHH77089.1 peptidase M20 [Streptomyces sulfonofaciens]
MPETTAVRWRRDIHRHPEVGFTEFRTASLIAGRLADLGWQVRTGQEVISPGARLGVPGAEQLEAAYRRAAEEGADQRHLPSLRGGNTAVVATWQGARPGRALALRADIDALPITESDAADHLPARDGFRSAHDGVMHACGHDGHIGIAMELAERIAAEPPEAGSLTLLFQPAEEGGRGARAMVPSGVVDSVDVFLAAHLGLNQPTGTVASSLDGLLANAKIRAVFRGVAAHASLAPHEGRNALLGAAAATLAVQGLPRVPGHETRVAVGAIHGGTSSNIVPDTAEVLLETRADDGDVNADLEDRARRALRGAAETYGLGVDIELIGSVTTARADRGAVELVEAAAAARGLRLVTPSAESGVASDDATAFMRRVQERGGSACYLAVGADLAAPHHTPRFDFDEAALGLGVDLLEEAVRRSL